MTGLAGLGYGQSVSATIDASKTSAPISPYVYGQFVEHIGNIINSGLWAEMVDDRKFYGPIPAPAAPVQEGPRFARMRTRPWTIVGPVESVKMDLAHPYVGKHSPLISTVMNEPRGIEQAGIGIVGGKTYVGRIILSGPSSAKVTVSLIWGPNSSDRSSVTIGKLSQGYEKFPLRFSAPVSADGARLQIVGTGTGSFEVGAVSLMPSDNQDGFRSEVVGVLKQLHSGVYRVPGGNFVSAFEWRDAIGDPDKRAPKYDPVWGAVQPNDVGTDEFMKFCKLVDVEPYITVSAGFGDAWSAKDYVEYCNSGAGTPMGRQRAINGHREPYHVKFWGIGNESWGFSYQFGAMKLAQYEYKHNAFAEAMRSVDPTIKLIGSGAMADTMTGSKESLNLGDSLIPKPLGPADWTGGLFLHCLDSMDLISEHFYNYGATHYDLTKAQQVPNDPNESLSTWMRRPANHVRLKVEEYQQYENLIPELRTKPVPISLDEWAYSGGPANSYKVAPAYAWALQEMFRHSELYQMACFTFATAMFSSNRSQAVLNPTGLTFKMYREHFGTIPVSVTGNSPQPQPTDSPGGEQPAVNAGSDTFPLDVVAAWTTDRKALTIAVINTSDTDRQLDLHLEHASLDGKGTLWRIAPSSLLATRSVNGKSEVEVESHPIESVPSALLLPKFSVSIYVLSAK
jgi:alpha-N-arabinofuranosidase